MSHLLKSLINYDGIEQALRKVKDFLVSRKSIFFLLPYIPRQSQNYSYLRTRRRRTFKGDRKMYVSERNECDSLVFVIRNKIIMVAS